MYNPIFFDAIAKEKIGTTKITGGTEPFEELFYLEYFAAHIYLNKTLGIFGKTENECQRHADMYGGSVKYGWYVTGTERC